MIETEKIKTHIATLQPSFIGKLIYYLIPVRKKVIVQNIRQVFGKTLSQQEMAKLMQCFYSHVMQSISENIVMRFMSEKQIQSKAEVVGYEIVLKQAEQKKGIIILTGHFGNWEFAPIAGILNFKQFQGKFHFVRKTIGNKYIEKILFNRYYKAGLHVIPKKNSLQQVCDALDNNDAVIFIMDQHANIAAKDGIAVDFFGKKAGTYRSLAMIARHNQVPVIPATSYRKANGKHVLEFFQPIAWINCVDSKQELHENTKAYNQALEKMILAHPEQWLWMHRRWKL